MRGPRFHAGMLVEVVGLGARTGPKFVGRRFILWGQPIAFQGLWCWPVPEPWVIEVEEASGKPEGEGLWLHAPEHRLRPIYDGDEPSSWDRCAWRPTEEVIPDPRHPGKLINVWDPVELPSDRAR